MDQIPIFHRTDGFLFETVSHQFTNDQETRLGIAIGTTVRRIVLLTYGDSLNITSHVPIRSVHLSRETWHSRIHPLRRLINPPLCTEKEELNYVQSESCKDDQVIIIRAQLFNRSYCKSFLQRRNVSEWGINEARSRENQRALWQTPSENIVLTYSTTAKLPGSVPSLLISRRAADL